MAGNTWIAPPLTRLEKGAKTDAFCPGGIFSFIKEKGPVIAAVSGGGDSMSLLFLARAWAKKTGREIRVVTVNHGMRPQANREAEFVAEICDELNVPHATLTWDGEKPSTGISAAARAARYGLMEKFALDTGARIILTGHTQDDQAETVLMRLKRCQINVQSGSLGHSGMCRRVSLGRGIALLRPLLSFSRKQLRDYLSEMSRTWMEDPSNCDERYERVQVRNALENNSEIKNKLLNYAAVMARARVVVADAAARLLGQTCLCKSGHVFELEVDRLRLAVRPVVSMAIKTVIAVAGGEEYLVSDRKLEKVMNTLRKGLSQRITLGNCIIESDCSGMRIFREVRNLPCCALASGESLFWDGRVRLVNNSGGNISVGVMSEKRFMAFKDGRKTMRNADQALVSTCKEACLSSPFVFTDAGEPIPLYFDVSSLPAQVSARSGARAIENFCPEWDFPLLEWLRGINLVAGQPSSYCHGGRFS